ncbi:hypothetical protein QAD02_016843 [Eretmocerus hayati]|uniref:Uncharacterized protein n=1 Tax=Eretmocerus hayati TaxID=131215 RepID=A0ACC2PE25_9HYME|nr:hypothetical protein QAD02_016843 [Eretmocerus hayati]
MSITDIYSSNVQYLYRVRSCSASAIVVWIAIFFTITIPLFFIHHTGGYWIRTRTYWEKPDVHFKHKYFLMIDQGNSDPLVCSTFSHYKDNVLRDDCNLVKVQEVDNDANGIQDALHLEILFYSNKPIRSLILLLFFNYELKEHIRVISETMTVIEHTLAPEVQEIEFIGDLSLRQNDALIHDEIYHVEDNSTDLNHFTINELLLENTHRLLSGTLTNLRILPKLGYIKDEAIIIKAQIYYTIQAINYRPGFWEEIKWAWMQYLSIFVIVMYFIRRVLNQMFSTQRLQSYIVVPWGQKSKLS